MVPYDVLVDPLSLPSHPVIQERENVLDILYGEPEDSSDAYDSGGEQVWTMSDDVFCHQQFTDSCLLTPAYIC